jgi:molecular chaperone HtpG
MTTGKINVSVENIFPLIKKFIQWSLSWEIDFEWYWCHFKIKTPTSIGEAKVEYRQLSKSKSIKKVKKFIIDQGLGMTADEVEKYINQVAFSGAEEF